MSVILRPLAYQSGQRLTAARGCSGYASASNPSASKACASKAFDHPSIGCLSIVPRQPAATVVISFRYSGGRPGQTDTRATDRKSCGVGKGESIRLDSLLRLNIKNQ